MSDKRHSEQEDSSPEIGGAGQTIVSLCGVSEIGMVFSSRHRFEVASEMQMRVRWDVLPAALQARLKPDESGWVCVRGFVVECRATRQPGGVAVFQVTLVLDVVLMKRPSRRFARLAARCIGHGSLELFGLN